MVLRKQQGWTILVNYQTDHCIAYICAGGGVSRREVGRKGRGRPAMWIEDRR
jgi:hypothetical protein